MLKGYVANTDLRWFRFLASRPDLDEVNFWQPSGRRRFAALAPGEPLFFKLKAPLRKIAGFGVFVRSEILPEWLAWECFGEGNGAPDLAVMHDIIQRYRAGGAPSSPRSARIGCVVLSRPIFLPEPLWVDPPEDWRRNVVAGKTYDLTQGIGERILRECQERARMVMHDASHASVSADRGEVLDAYGRGVLVRPRLGQGSFKLAVREAYRSACAVTGEHSLPALDAAHIRPFRIERRHEIRNGLLLRSDLHKLYDRGYVTVTPEGRFRVSERLREEFRNGRSYYPLDGRAIRLPDKPEWQPDPDRLAWHAESVFLS